MKIEELVFLEESNAIEGVFDDVSLDQAVIAWKYLKKQTELTKGVVLKTHKILMLKDESIAGFERGYFRRRAVYIGGREALHYSKIEQAINEWIDDAWVSLEVPGDEGHNIKIDHIEYEKIHPFIDGNGRTGRMFMNWQRLQCGLPILIIKEEERFEYYKWFK